MMLNQFLSLEMFHENFIYLNKKFSGHTCWRARHLNRIISNGLVRLPIAGDSLVSSINVAHGYYNSISMGQLVPLVEVVFRSFCMF